MNAKINAVMCDGRGEKLGDVPGRGECRCSKMISCEVCVRDVRRAVQLWACMWFTYFASRHTVCPLSSSPGRRKSHLSSHRPGTEACAWSENGCETVPTLVCRCVNPEFKCHTFEPCSFFLPNLTKSQNGHRIAFAFEPLFCKSTN